MVAVNDLMVDFGGNGLFDGVSFMLGDKERVALVGKNGAGKSTMLKIFAGLMEPHGGTVSMSKGMRVGYLPQHLMVNDGKTVLDEVKTAFNDVIGLQQEVDRIVKEIGERTDYESVEYGKLLERLDDLNGKIEIMGGSSMMAEIERTMVGLGFEREDLGRQTKEFSGGWRMRIELAKILLARPDLLLLDEPTNHLDIESIQWLENFLKTAGSALMLVSHDRAFLDAVTTRTIEISLGQIYDYKVPYTQYVELRKERREMQMRAYENQQKMIADTEDFIERFRYKATKAVQVQSRVKQLEKLERIEIDEEDNSTLRLKFPPAPHSGVLPVDIEGLTKAYGDHVVLRNIDLQIKRGEKIAFVGKNGEGKSTLVKCIMEEIDHAGKMKLGHGVKIGYFAQNQASLLDENVTVFDTIDRVAVGDIRTKIRDILGAFMFGGEASEKLVKVLSGGERSRLAMIKLLLEPVNLLILDEPTNHLDMRSKDVLKEAIQAFDGTVIVVSHDRDFLDGLVDKVYGFAGGGIRCYDTLGEFLMSIQNREENAPVQEKKSEEQTDGRIEYEKRKEAAREAKRKEKEIEKIENEIAKIEKEVAEMEEKFATGESSEQLMEQYGKAKKLLDEKMYEWEILSME